MILKKIDRWEKFYLLGAFVLGDPPSWRRWLRWTVATMDGGYDGQWLLDGSGTAPKWFGHLLFLSNSLDFKKASLRKTMGIAATN